MSTTSTGQANLPVAAQVAVLTAGVSHPSTTLKLAADIAEGLEVALAEHDIQMHSSVINVADHAAHLAAAMTGGFIDPRLQSELDNVREADIVIVATPVYKAGISGLFKMFIDALDDDAVLGTPVILAATAGTPRHALVVDGPLRSLFAYLRAMAVPTSVFAATEDWERPRALQRRLQRATIEARALFEASVRDTIRGQQGYRRQVTNSTDDVHIDSDLLAAITGGSLPPR